MSTAIEQTVIEQDDNLQMSFLDHLDELRRRLINSVIIVAIAFSICFAFADYIYRFLAVPVVEQLQKERRTRQVASGTIDIAKVKEGEIVQYTFTQEIAVSDVKVPLGTTIPVKRMTQGKESLLVLATPWSVGKTILPAETPLNQIIKEGSSRLFFDDENNRLVLRGVTSAFMVYLRVALYSGIALAVPFLFYQLWAFISPGLYKHEKKYIVPVLAMATIFFALGASFAYKIAFPAACDYLLGWAEQGGFRTLLDAEDYLDLIIMIMIGLGIVFQIPTIAFVLGRIGLVTPRLMIRVWRYAVIVIAIIAAVLTPTPDAFNMMMFAAPMLGLYFLSIGIVWVFGKPRRTDEEVGSGQ
ncbi:MAG: twin-arginine translocase subunit TatC [Acidobacteriota bacterium]|nr:MAG: twin-arginine translocase subunit TatC [Acidobacteriota bacterium]